MVTSVPAWFGGKAQGRKPAGLDVTTITDTSGSMGPYIDFITSSDVYRSLETAFLAENIGVSPQNKNKYSFCVAADKGNIEPPLKGVETKITVGGVSNQRWASGDQILGNDVVYPNYTAAGSDGENVLASLNTIQANNRGYNTLNQRVTIAGSDQPLYMAPLLPDPAYPSIYVGVHQVFISEDGSLMDPPRPEGTLVGMVYTTDSVGVAIYIESSGVINYRENMPVTGIRIRPFSQATKIQPLIDNAIATNGAIYNIAFFDSPERYALLAESLGSVLGKYLYSVT